MEKAADRVHVLTAKQFRVINYTKGDKEPRRKTEGGESAPSTWQKKYKLKRNTRLNLKLQWLSLKNNKQTDNVLIANSGVSHCGQLVQGIIHLPAFVPCLLKRRDVEEKLLTSCATPADLHKCDVDNKVCLPPDILWTFVVAAGKLTFWSAPRQRALCGAACLWAWAVISDTRCQNTHQSVTTPRTGQILICVSAGVCTLSVNGD